MSFLPPGRPATYAFLPLLGVLNACAASTSEPPGEELDVTCPGKCDGFESIRSLLRDPSGLELDDLVELGTPFVTEQVNDLLAFSDYAQFEIAETRGFDEQKIDQLVTGLAARFGEHELTTEVNQLRLDHLRSSSDSVFAEAAFQFNLSGDLSHSFDFPVPDFIDGDGTVSLGFSGQAPVEARVVTAYPSLTSAVVNAPLRAAYELRDFALGQGGFVMPRSLEDIRAMKPGELVALNAHGHVALNLGAGVPLLVADPLSWASYSIVFSAGLRTRLSGDLDIQMVRLDGDEVVIDVGLEKAKVVRKRLAIEDRWGIQGLLDFEVDVAGFDLDLGSIAENALEGQLNRHVGLLSARWEDSDVSLRMSIARLRFNLDQANPEILGPAIAQALRGDVRLAQALSNRGEPGVVAEFDLMRSGASSTSYAGIDILGLRFFTETVEGEGNIVIQTPGGARSILFESLQHSSSSGPFSHEGFNRVVLSGLVFPPPLPWLSPGEVNLIFQATEGDLNMKRDQILDHIDGIILGVGGATAMRVVEQNGNAIQRFVEEECQGFVDSFPGDDPGVDTAEEQEEVCRQEVVNDPSIVELRQLTMEALDREIEHLSADLQNVVRTAADVRLRQQSVQEDDWGDFTWGPDARVLTDFRLDEGALSEIFSSGGQLRFMRSVEEYLGVTEIDREASENEIAAERQRIRNLYQSGTEDGARLNALEELMITYSHLYRTLKLREGSTISTLGQIGENAVAVHIPVDENRRPLYEEALNGTVVQLRGKLVAELVDLLIANADGLGPHPAQTVAYGLLGVVDPERLDLRTRMDFEFQWYEPGWEEIEHPEVVDRAARGAMVAPIDGGMFSVDALIDID